MAHQSSARRSGRGQGTEAQRLQTVKHRHILDALTRSRLLEVAQAFEVSGLTGQPKEEIIAALWNSLAISTGNLLGALKRAELKAACQAAGLDDGGRGKAEIIARLLGRNGSVESTPTVDASIGNAPKPSSKARRGRRSNGESRLKHVLSTARNRG